MSAFNILQTKACCSSCFNESSARIQFKFGDTWQLEYMIGDKIKWGGNDNGRPGFIRVKVYGIIESTKCPVCNKHCLPEEYDILIEHDVIMGALPISNPTDYTLGNEKYVVLE